MEEIYKVDFSINKLVLPGKTFKLFEVTGLMQLEIVIRIVEPIIPSSTNLSGMISFIFGNSIYMKYEKSKDYYGKVGILTDFYNEMIMKGIYDHYYYTNNPVLMDNIKFAVYANEGGFENGKFEVYIRPIAKYGGANLVLFPGGEAI